MNLQWMAECGLVACASIDDYESNVIKKHENTRADKELDRITHVDTCNAQTGPIFLAYRANAVINGEIDKAKKAVHLLGGVKENAIYFDLPDSDIGRSLVIVKKKEPTSKKYPRKAGLPSKEPLQ